MEKGIRYIVLWCVLLFSLIESKAQMTHNIKQDTFVAGESIVLEFDIANESPSVLHCHSALGSTVLSPLENNINQLQFKLPDFMAKKSGIVSWRLIVDKIEYKGKILIQPTDDIGNIETYLGPPDILAGGKDYTMFVSLPTDIYDNPLTDSTQVNLDYYFKNKQTSKALFIENGMVYKRIFSPNKSGRLFVSSECGGVHSKEYDVNIQPALPIDFTISTEGHHFFADGNQILTFNTSVLTDTFGNVISDGTMVEFYIKNKNFDFLRTRGATQNGIASAHIIHPEFKDTWQVEALVNGMASSNRIQVEFEQVVNAFDVDFLENNRIVKIGPVQSYMHQRVPDGFKAYFNLYKDNILIKSEIREMHNGYTTFYIDPNEISKGKYTMHIEVAGICRTFENLEL